MNNETMTAEQKWAEQIAQECRDCKVVQHDGWTDLDEQAHALLVVRLATLKQQADRCERAERERDEAVGALERVRKHLAALQFRRATHEIVWNIVTDALSQIGAKHG